MKLQEGTWYTHTDDKCCYYITRIHENGKYDAFGLDYKGRWRNNEYFGSETDQNNKRINVATTKEVIEALIKEAKKRYNAGDIVKSLKNNTSLEIANVSNFTNAANSEDELWASGVGLNPKIFYKGKWATKVYVDGKLINQIDNYTMY